MNVYRSKLKKNKIHTEGISIDQTSPITIWTKSSYTPEIIQLTATITPADASFQEITWSSSDTSVVVVNEIGQVERVGHGTAIITASTEDGNTDSVTVNVNYGVNLASKNWDSLTIYTGHTSNFNVYIMPEYATGYVIEWSSSDTSVATVEGNENNCVATAVHSGSCDIICTITEPHFNNNQIVVTFPIDVISGTANELIVTEYPKGDLVTGGGKIFFVTTNPSDATNRFDWTYNISTSGCYYRDLTVQKDSVHNNLAVNFLKTYPTGTDASVTVTITLGGLSASCTFKITGAPY